MSCGASPGVGGATARAMVAAGTADTAKADLRRSGGRATAILVLMFLLLEIVFESQWKCPKINQFVASLCVCKPESWG